MKRLLVLLLLTSIAFSQDVTPKGQQVDNFPIKKAKGGVVLGSDHVAGIHYLRSKGVFGVDSSVTDVSAAFPLPTSPNNIFGILASNGSIPGLSGIRKFGQNADVDAAEDIWSVGGIIAWPDTAGEVMTISSTDADDTGAGAGAQTVQVFYLSVGFVEYDTTITLTGQSGVTFARVISRINRARVITAGASETAEGDIYIGTGTITTGTPANIFAHIPATKNQTQTTGYTVPVGKTGYIVNWVASILGTNAAKGADLTMKVRPVGEVFRDIAPIAAVSNGNGDIYEDWTWYSEICPAKTDMKLSALSVTNTDTQIAGGYTVILIGN